MLEDFRMHGTFLRISVPALVSMLMTAAANAQCPCGNQTAHEYGDALYRKLNFPIGPDYNHVGIFAGLRQSDGAPRVMHALNQDNATVEGPLSDITEYGVPYYGAYTSTSGSGANPNFTSRRSIVATASNLVAAQIGYEWNDALDYEGLSFDGSIADILDIRCDGFVEYAYESNGWIAWYPYAASSHWSILSYPGDHNNMPDLTKNPDTECSPWAQRGAPGHSTSYGNSKLKTPAVIDLPTYQVTQTSGTNYVDVAIRATDKSGIHRIGYMPPGSTTWSFSPRQPQHPTSDSYTYTVRVYQSGPLYYYAMDNAYNFPTLSQVVTINLPKTLTVSNQNPGGGSVISTDAGINCGGDCSQTYPHGSQVTLNAIANTGYSFAAWSGSCSSTSTTCNLSMTSDRSVSASFSATPVTYTLSVSNQNPSGGNVTSADGGINCGGDCDQTYSSGTSVTLSANPSAGYSFAGWGGSCSGSSLTCNFIMNGNRSVTANFTANPATYTLSISNQNPSGGSVTSTDGGINCGGDCGQTYSSGTSVTLSANPSAGYSFAGWGGSCSGSSLTCNFTMNGNRSVTANFTVNPVTYTLSISNQSPSGGSVASTDGGINCGGDCSQTYGSGASVTLIASPSSGYLFSGWGGNCSGASTIHSLTMNTNKVCTASFVPGSGLDFFTVSPCRVIDTRNYNPLASAVTYYIQLAGFCGIPASAKAVAANVTAVGAAGTGYLILWPADLSIPLASTINFSANQSRANNTILRLATDGLGDVAARAVLSNGSTVHLIIDVAGYYQ